MEYNRIVAVTGMPGLYEVLTSKSDGAIVRSLDDKSTKFVSSRVHNLSHLESIEVYTIRENVSLSELFSAMKDSKEKLPDVKDNKALVKYFEKVYPDIDLERVYASDMKKMIKWFEVLNQNEVDFSVKEEEPVVEEIAEETAAKPSVEKVPVKETVAETKPKTKAKSKTTTAKSEVTKEKGEKPKSGRKKKTEE